MHQYPRAPKYTKDIYMFKKNRFRKSGKNVDDESLIKGTSKPRFDKTICNRGVEDNTLLIKEK